jgi:aminodeoxyfutalosine synthase
MSKNKACSILKDAGLIQYPVVVRKFLIAAIREKICADKVNADGWLAIHEAAHKLGCIAMQHMLLWSY